MCKNRQKVVFSKIVNQYIFADDFTDFQQNNIIDSNNKPIAILYAPNGVGKTSLARVLDNAPGTDFEAVYSSTIYSSHEANAIFHVIADQNRRNIIQGKTEDFVLGDNIRDEQKLKQEIDMESERIIDECKNILKKYGITKKEAPIINDYEQDIQNAIKMIVKRGGKYEDALDGVLHLNNYLGETRNDGVDLQAPRVQRYLNDRNDLGSILIQFLEVNLDNATKNKRIREISENTDAILLLNKYIQKDNCVICDNHITPEELIKKKELNRQQIIEQLDEEHKVLIERIMSTSDSEDVLDIKAATEQFFETGDIENIHQCQEEIMKLGQQIVKTAEQELSNLFKTTVLFEKISEHEKIITSTPEITDEDMLYLQEVVSQSMDKKIQVKRDANNKNLIITLDDQKIVGELRDNLHLSAGEQNFLSLAFEILKAKNSEARIVVLDDPISSFDSIYKYKIVYSILRIINDKKIILLTHNVDLIRLVRAQRGNCFQMYILNNGEGGKNGFIAVSDAEVDLIIDLSKMVDFFRTIAPSAIKSVREYLVATVPFMRSFSKIVNDEMYKKLMPLMHGHGDGKVDVAECYNYLFYKNKDVQDKFEVGKYIMSAQDIMLMSLPEDLQIVDTITYPLLNKALSNTVEYLKMRLIVEKNLIDQFNLPTNKDKTNEIILAAYSGHSENEVKSRTRLMAKKTLLNEFNHFEGNLSIFQPAIDISDQMLQKEKEDIEEFFAGEGWKNK